MPNKQTISGKAFEYSCLIALYDLLEPDGNISIVDNAQLKKAEEYYLQLDNDFQQDLNQAAKAAARVIMRLEPHLQYSTPQDGPLRLELQSASLGQRGDVRDVLCIKADLNWEIGISCKHNHYAVKHNRLSENLDFGSKWFGIPCSETYFEDIKPVFQKLASIVAESKQLLHPTKWADLENKAENYYVPVLKAFMKELKKLAEKNKEVPERLIRYLIGNKDFYKVIAVKNERTTKVEAINIANTLNKPMNGHKSQNKVTQPRLPSKFYSIDFKENSQTTIQIVCDAGWSISMRLHSASSRVESSLKFDVNLISTPSNMYSQREPWNPAY